MKYIIDIPDDRVCDYVGGIHLLIPYAMAGHKGYHDTGLNLTPYTEPSQKAIDLQHAHDIENVARMNYSKGTEEAWEFAKKVRLEVFTDEEGRLRGYISGFDSYSEAKTKYEERLKQKEGIHVGDEVEYVEDHRKKIVVTSTYSDGWFDAIDSNGYLYINRNPVMWKKTGRHFPEFIELLKKMGEES